MFFKIFLVLILINYSACDISEWSQCGGPNWNSISTCVTGYICYIQGYYFSQCRPVGDCPSGWNCSIYTNTNNNNNSSNQLSAWSQCGGQNWNSISICVTGYNCYIQDYYYSQCRPVGDCPSGWNCSILGSNSFSSATFLSTSSLSTTTSTYSTTSSSYSTTSSSYFTTSSSYSSKASTIATCLSTQFYNAKLKICQIKGNYAKGFIFFFFYFYFNKKFLFSPH